MGRLYSLVLLLAAMAWPISAAGVEGEFNFDYAEEQQPANWQVNMQMQDELQKLQTKISDLQQQLELANKQKSDLAVTLGKLDVKGESNANFRNFNLNGPGIDAARDFLGRTLWYDSIESDKQLTGSKANERISLVLLGRPIPQLAIGSNLEILFTWAGGKQIAPADELYISADFDTWQTVAGTYWAQFSPLTLFFPMEKPLFEGDIFAQKRNSWLTEQKIKGNLRRLEGFSGQFQVDNLHVRGLVSRVAGSPYHRFLYGLEGKLALDPSLELTGNLISYRDDLASASSGKAMDNLLLGLAGEWQLREDCSLRGEYVRSSYDDDLAAGLPPAYDRAFTGEFDWENKQLKLLGRFVDVGPFYWAPTAQSRDYTLKTAGIFGSQTAQTAMGGLVSEAADQALPYGLATPNRNGIQISATYELPSGAKFFLEHWQFTEKKPSEAGKLTEQMSARRNFYVEKIGGQLPLTKLIKTSRFSFPLKETNLTGQWERRSAIRRADPESGTDARVHKSEVIADLGLSYQLVPGWQLLIARKSQIWQDALQASAERQDTVAMGVKTKLGSNAFLQLSVEKFNAQQARGTITGLKVEAEF